MKPSDDRVEILLSWWLALHSQGQAPSSEQLHRIALKLLPEVRRRLAVLGQDEHRQRPSNRSGNAAALSFR